MSQGVEWGAHCCMLIGWLGSEQAVPTARLAEAFDLPTAYLNKCLQALTRAGILTSTPGARGGFRLARPFDQVTLLDVIVAIEGPDDAFHCSEIRRKGMGAQRPVEDFLQPCGISRAFRQAELNWRKELATQTLADLARQVPSGAPEAARRWYSRATA
ncbi:RrF2 family transcriptional regulator [Nocardia jiangsuensis]|uniref:RrF2 family transcriptional regulator n=1 Tax=Nocardia jiangsuensis TaxID=1691563 RepID=A0ABV8E0L7_9NOCA